MEWGKVKLLLQLLCGTVGISRCSSKSKKFRHIKAEPLPRGAHLFKGNLIISDLLSVFSGRSNFFSCSLVQFAIPSAEYFSFPRQVTLNRGISSLIAEVEAGHGVTVGSTVLKLVAGKRVLYRPITGTTEVQSIGIACAKKGDVTPAGEKFCD